MIWENPGLVAKFRIHEGRNSACPEKGGFAVTLWGIDNKNPVTGVWVSGSHLAG